MLRILFWPREKVKSMFTKAYALSILASESLRTTWATGSGASKNYRGLEFWPLEFLGVGPRHVYSVKALQALLTIGEGWKLQIRVSFSREPTEGENRPECWVKGSRANNRKGSRLQCVGTETEGWSSAEPQAWEAIRGQIPPKTGSQEEVNKVWQGEMFGIERVYAVLGAGLLMTEKKSNRQRYQAAV